MRFLTPLICAAFLSVPAVAPAHGLFSPAVTVNDEVITNYEVDQRVLLLDSFGTMGDLDKIAREQLIDDRLRLAYMSQRGIQLTEAGLTAALEDFAARSDLSFDELAAQFAEEGISPETLRDYVKVNTTWRDFIRNAFRDRVNITDADIDAEIANGTGYQSELQLLLSEIIMPYAPEKAELAAQVADEISQMTSFDAFSEAATRYSALPTKEDGGRLPWRSTDEYPAGLVTALLGLEPGQVTKPIELENAFALLQLRGIREVSTGYLSPTTIDYALLTIPGGLSPEALAEAARIDAATDNCDDLYTIARDYPSDRLQRLTLSPSQIETDIALELARLDTDESSATLTRDSGQTLLYLMMCERQPGEPLDRDAVKNLLTSRALSQYADQLLADLHDNAVIIEQ